MLCTTIKRDNYKDLLNSVSKYPFVEIRLDDMVLTKREIVELVKIPDVKKIITVRNESKTDDTKLRELLIAAEAGCEYIDVEMDYNFANEFCRETLWLPTKTILSYHDMEGVPEPTFFKEVEAKAEAISAEIIKIACYCKKKNDVLDIIKLYKNHRLKEYLNNRLIALPIGKDWEAHRLAMLDFGAPFVYVCEDGEEAVAEGQVPYSVALQALEQMKQS